MRSIMSVGARLSSRLPRLIAHRPLTTAASPTASSSSSPSSSSSLPSAAIPTKNQGTAGLRPPMWTTVDPLPLTRSSFLSVLEGTTPLILERGFLSKETSQALTDHIGPRASPYLHVAGPQMKRLGVAQFEFQAQSADDFKTRGSHRTFLPSSSSGSK
jgi:hypothetical protein